MRPLARIIVILIAAFTLGIVAARAGQLTVGDLTGKWELVEIAARQVPRTEGTALPGFTIKDQSISGFDGCNTFSGRLDKPGSIASTRRGCPEDVVKLPLDLANPMSHLKAGTIQGDTLVLPARVGTPAATFKRVTSKPE